ncbi:hypothetical protein [Serratia marcescens]|uniref:hypothetical protein n=1 Tax=Serratia marcescens TaxID=615 RepID=UPI000744E619|nr:hypothetical protein [Serratia marcescens]MBH3207864.1 hypothetical protein [Serratia marcescens]MDP8744592.1 hypothetical protein [Serratia marcescens]NCI53359.1 hypothetical protein [Serratia marcescens]NDJ05459.1 hypothetical protein [Serratia marcescens]NDJ31885.1 hypothetical protein [Serratia marcescens]
MKVNLKVASVFVMASIFLISGCSVLNGFKVKGVETYQEPTDVKNISRVRFISNVTGTRIKPLGSESYNSLVYYGVWGHYNSTRDIGIPKISYRKSDYEGYYYEVKVKSGVAEFIINTDSTFRGVCMTRFEFVLLSGKDYDINFNANESRDSCRLYVSEIARDESTGLLVLKPVEVKSLMRR